MLRYLSAGESHGKCLSAIIEGIPSNFELDIDAINKDLSRRQHGHGRGKRMLIEKDRIQILSGLRNSKTTGSPITLQITNKDWDNWVDIMNPVHAENILDKRVTRPRPGHADLAGTIKYNQNDIRNILERASARETAIRTAVGSVCRQILKSFDIWVLSHVLQIGAIKAPSYYNIQDIAAQINDKADKSPVRCIDEYAQNQMIEEIDNAKKEGDSLGGVFEIIALGLPLGIGSHVHWDRKLDAKLSYSLMSIQGIKGIEIGLGFACASMNGSKIHDEIYYDHKFGYHRKTNNAGGIEGGISNGQDIVIKAVMKPIPTLYKPLNSVDMDTKVPYKASVERSDNCAVPAASIVGESAVCWTLLEAFFEKFGGDSAEEVSANLKSYLSQWSEL